MDPADRRRLEKLLGMLGSTFDGERANAARMIAAMAERHGITIAEMVLGSVTREAPRPRTAKPQGEKAKAAAVILAALKDIATSEDELEFVVTAWEFQFAVDVSGKHSFDYELSAKQMAAAQRIIDKVEAARRRAGAA